MTKKTTVYFRAVKNGDNAYTYFPDCTASVELAKQFNVNTFTLDQIITIDKDGIHKALIRVHLNHE